MSRTFAVVLRILSVAFGAMWLAAAVSKALSPLDAYEFAGRVVPMGFPALAGVGLVAWSEGTLGALMVLGAVRGFAATAGALAAFSWLLVHVKQRYDGLIPCGCFSTFGRGNVDSAIDRNAVLIGVAVACALCAWISDRRRTRDAAAASGPARS